MSSQKIKILFASQIYGQQVHGPSRKLFLLADALSEKFSMIDLRVMTEDSTSLRKNDYLLHFKMKSKLLAFLAKYWRSKYYFERAKEIYLTWPFDILIFNDAPKALLASYGSSHPFKVVAMLNDTNSIDTKRRSYETIRKFMVRRFLSIMERKVARKVDLIVCPSLYLAKQAKRQYQLETLPSVLHPAINLKEWQTLTPRKRSKKKTLLFLKSDPHRGGLHLLLKALDNHACEAQFSKLIIAGLDPEEENYFSSIAPTNSITLEWKGKLNREGVKNAIYESHIGVVPSLHEAFSITTAEFAVGGLSVVASDADGIPEGARNFATFFKSGDSASLCNALLAVAKENKSPIQITYDHLEMGKCFQEIVRSIT